MTTSNEPNRMKAIRDSYQALAILRVAYREPSYRVNGDVLGKYLDQLGLGNSAADLRANLETLEKFGVLKLNFIERIPVIELTQPGVEVALGRAMQEGIQRPDPDCPY